MHKNNLEKIKDDYEKSVDQINESYRLKKEEYNNIKGNFKPEIKAIREESEEKLGALSKQQRDLTKSIDSLKEAMKDEQDKYNAEVSAMSKETENVLATMEKEHNERIDALVYEHETVPSKELNSVKGEFEIKRKEYDNRIQEIGENKKKLDEEEKAINDDYNAKKSQADTELALKNDEFVKTKYDLEKQTKEFSQTLANRKKELNSFREDISTLEQQYRNKKEIEFVDAQRELEEKYKDQIESFKTNEETVANNYNNEINNILIDINSKKAKLDFKIGKILEKQNAEKTTTFAVRKNE